MANPIRFLKRVLMKAADVELLEKKAASSYDEMVRAVQRERELEKERDLAWDSYHAQIALKKEKTRMLDALTKDLLETARSSSMAEERAWQATQLAKIYKARLDAYEGTPRGIN